MKVFEKSKWIWPTGVWGKDTHAEFYGEFVWKDGDCICRLSCDSDYTLYVNGDPVSCNQYGDYEHFKIYDTVDLKPYLRHGKNSFAVHVWYFGEDSQRYYPATAGLIFEVISGTTTLLVSDENIQGRKSLAYSSGVEKKITYQLGYSFCYNANLDDDWKTGGGSGFSPCETVMKNCTFFARPNEKLVFKGKSACEILENNNGRHYIVDLLEESVGVPCLSLYSDCADNSIMISYGELLENGRVKRFIGPRDFSFEYIAKAGQNDFIHYCLRLGCRYLELHSKEPIRLEYAGVLLQEYPVSVGQVRIEDEFDRWMYDVSVKSLQLCMLEHYMDCPWREQNLYAFDSRNQILFGYYAFTDKNAKYVRSNLELYGKSKLVDGLFPICAPCGIHFSIPSFALHYFLELKEYVEYTQDTTLAKELFPKLCAVLDKVLENRKDGVMLKFEGEQYWNFYDWSAYMDGTLGGTDNAVPDVMINILTVMALRCMRYICNHLQLPYTYAETEKELIENTRKFFFVEKDGLFSMTVGEQIYTEIANSLAVLNGFVTEEEGVNICKKLVSGELSPSSMSMKVFKYDALLKTNEKEYAAFVLSDLRKDFKIMKDNGATSTWETIEGSVAFENAGSLCHGWTALPIYYFHRLGIIKK
ncbi:MAG: hypothetical protein IJX30_05415 [Clostridia bacterium]|nr:hypothetical protein [Clostridia bacterium]